MTKFICIFVNYILNDNYTKELNTKDKILIASKKLFNEKGFGAPTLNLLAQQLGISRGNLTYYFKDKDALLQALAEEMWAKYEASIGRAMKFPSWGSTNNTTKVYLELHQEYTFIFFDHKVTNHSTVKGQIKRMKRDLLERQMSTINFSIQIGNMKKESIPGTYRNLCETIWMINFYWLTSESYRDEEEKGDWDKLVWGIILPHFTEKGIRSFKEHFGEDYYQSLGEGHSKSIYKVMDF